MVSQREKEGCGDEICEIRAVDADRVQRARTALPTENETGRLAETFKIMGDPTRLKILMALSGEELCVCDLSALLGISESATSHQLRLLRTLRLVRNRKEGKMVYYALDDEHILDLIQQGLVHVRE